MANVENRSYQLRVWRQAGPNNPGKLVDYRVKDIDPSLSFLEMLDHLNETLISEGENPIEFESDCREGICGACGVVVDGRPHGPVPNITTCALRMREFSDGATITVEPFRATAFPLVKDLVVDRSPFDRIMQKGGYCSVNTGQAPEANNLRIGKDTAEMAMDSAACIGCGACVASCPNASASLFVGAKVRQLSLLPQGDVERATRALGMVDQMDAEGFGDCSNHGECEAACPKAISIGNISTLRREYMRALTKA
ncbi:MAG: succinate dehydrogenase/fumarate reductase iron-sulfur subunit [Candidatus Binatia bacterium]|jgi:succinate dehydrogenase / fumarate reductase iron-sulfur subunit|nr:succinate dehydrogenase/fumarate reductase iron-sulfur subunit [Candidatus Binatia bacterium]MDG1958159.1 succinate dehydrogenase/fumarate reductase iron-sulfur subunit [Candidatus Binatia bacterium]MDG2008401.1 succinate dehydrogenase/fumarate reductase iron-sulfur subunit [Candidatus Binatia bacterium]HAC81383.1 succinate dehydrogenase/fumarate reductase iron-sulfur subunit [Deltaproteobacteria bacterium]